MALRLFNTLKRQIEPFVVRDPDQRRVGMYCCGPTVYDYAHIGNYRTFVFADLVRRYLEFRGYEVLHVMNITDVEDKIITRVKAAGQSLRVYTTKYETAFLEDMTAAHCEKSKACQTDVPLRLNPHPDAAMPPPDRVERSGDPGKPWADGQGHDGTGGEVD